MEKIFKKPYRCYKFETVNFLSSISNDDIIVCNSLVDIEHLRSYAGKYFKGKFRSKQQKNGFIMELKGQ